MKKILSVLAMAVVCLAIGSTSYAGICITVPSTCNNYYFTLSSTEDPDIFAMTGYEYGCSLNDRLASGTARVEGNTVYVGFTGSNGVPGFADFGQSVAWNGYFDIATLAGEYVVTYSYVQGGALTGHGIGGATTAALCSNPALESHRPAARDMALGEKD